MLAGHLDIEGLCLSLGDWTYELRALQEAHGLAPVSPHAAHVPAVGTCLVCSTKTTAVAKERRKLATQEKEPASAEAGRAEDA